MPCQAQVHPASTKEMRCILATPIRPALACASVLLTTLPSSSRDCAGIPAAGVGSGPLPRCCSGKAQVWQAWLERPIRLQRDRFQNQHGPHCYLPHQSKPTTSVPECKLSKSSKETHQQCIWCCGSCCACYWLCMTNQLPAGQGWPALMLNTCCAAVGNKCIQCLNQVMPELLLACRPMRMVMMVCPGAR